MIRIGTSGWRYPSWRGAFYPEGLAQQHELEYLSGRLDSVEINGSFYSLQRPDRYRGWYEQTPDGFLFAVKGGRFITHVKRLRDVGIPLANFFASGVLALRDKLGPVLWQLPASISFDRELCAEFFALLPRDTGAAGDLARRHDNRLDGREWTVVDADRPVRHAIEVRHPSFQNDEFLALARRYGIAVVVADTAGRFPYLEEVGPADFVYVRLHGDEELYASGYSGDALDRWADRVRCWSASRDVYVYFDNSIWAGAPVDAVNLGRRLHQPSGVAPG